MKKLVDLFHDVNYSFNLEVQSEMSTFNPSDDLKVKLFTIYGKFSYEHLSREIRKRGLIKVTRFQIYQVFKGRMTSATIRKALAELVDEPVERFWPETTVRKKKSKRADPIPSTESPSTQ